MRRLSIILIIVVAAFGDITVGLIDLDTLMETPDQLPLIVAELAEVCSTIDLVIASDQALSFSDCRERTIFGRDSLGNITYAPWDTMTASAAISDILTDLCDFAAEHGITIIPGTLWEIDSCYRAYCTVPIIGPDGHITKLRRKCHSDYVDPDTALAPSRDSITTRDGTTYEYLITITNESKNIPELYTPARQSDFWVCLSYRWFIGHEILMALFESNTVPSGPYDPYFNYAMFEHLYPGFIDDIAPVFATSLNSNSGAFWIPNLFSALWPDDSSWYRMDSVIYLEHGKIVTCDPDTARTFTGVSETSIPEVISSDAWPNPSNDAVCFKCSPGNDLRIYNSRGELVHSTHIDGSSHIWRIGTACPAGVYLYQLGTGPGARSGKIIYLP